MMVSVWGSVVVRTAAAWCLAVLAAVVCFCRQNPRNFNPVENVWQFICDNWLSNRIFKSYDDLVDHCCEAWNKLVDQPWRIMTLGLRQWAHGF